MDPFKRGPATEGPAYLRIHGIDGYYYNYTDQDLKRLAEWIEPFHEAHVLFNNVSMWEYGLRFKEMISRV